jgi:hypothetical protein
MSSESDLLPSSIMDASGAQASYVDLVGVPCRLRDRWQGSATSVLQDLHRLYLSISMRNNDQIPPTLAFFIFTAL